MMRNNESIIYLISELKIQMHILPLLGGVRGGSCLCTEPLLASPKRGGRKLESILPFFLIGNNLTIMNRDHSLTQLIDNIAVVCDE